MLRSARVEPLRLPARSPNLNAYAERFVRTIRQECLNRMVFFREASLRRAMEEFVTHYQLRAEPSVVGEQNHSAGDDGVPAHRADPLPKTTRRFAQLLLSRGYWMNKFEYFDTMGILFDDNRLNTETAATLQKLSEMQLGDGRWPWFAGG